MKITLLISTFNSISQKYYTKLKDLNHKVDVVYAINDTQIIDEIEDFKPNIILCPFLKKFVPKEIFTKYDTYILHPGIIGDKGAYSIDNALRDNKKTWGVVILKANDDFDGGDIYASVDFILRDTSKASIYRNETYLASIKALEILLKNIKNDNFIPTQQKNTNMHLSLTQKHRAINWQKDTSDEIIKKINYSDSIPGVKDNILGVSCYLYGAWLEDKLKGEVKQIIAKRDGAICIGTIDGAIWVSHLKEIDKFKLPATYVLKDKLQGIKENRLPLIFDKSYNTFYEISCDIKNEVGYLHFNFHNGAFRAEQCIRLKYAIEYIKTKVKVLVLMGANDFFSNGINLNILEDSKKNGEDAWSNINAINDLVKSIIFCDDIITISALKNNAGAGGVFLALACDKVIAKDCVILNPHYKTLGLSGSEYHNFSLEKRVSKEISTNLLNKCMPISSTKAKEINLIDEVFNDDNFINELELYCDDLISNEDEYDEFIWEKQDYLEENEDLININKDAELKIMYNEFYKEDSIFHKLRYEFVYKKCPINTPLRLKYYNNE